MTVTGYGQKNRKLKESEIEAIIASGLDKIHLEDKRVLVIIPDRTRTMPMPLFFRLLTRYISGRASALNFLVALGTHPPLGKPDMLRLVGITAEDKEKTFQHVNLFNHVWKDPGKLTTLGVIGADEIEEISVGLLTEEVPVRLNRMVLEHDHLIICGPVFPHEVVGFSGGNKYFFPGIAGQEIIDLTHWLGALITSYALIGVANTPVRQVIDRAASFIPTARHAFCAVVTHEGVNGLYFGTPEKAYSAAANLSAKLHIRWVNRTYNQVLSMLPEMYEDIWTGAKGMYKLEPVIAEGGEVILYAPHIQEFSLTHGAVIREIGYHVRDYYTQQWDRFKDYPWSVLAHSTHLAGIGTYRDGIEQARIQVTLATGISQEECQAVNLGYRDPATIDPEEWAGRESEGLLLVPRAGEYLYRLKTTA